LQERANTRQAAANPDLPDKVRHLYRQSAHKADAALGILDAVERRKARQVPADDKPMRP